MGYTREFPCIIVYHLFGYVVDGTKSLVPLNPEMLKAIEIDNGLTLVPRIKLNLTVFPSTPLTLSNPIDEWNLKNALINFLHSTHSLSLPDDHLQIKRHKNLKKRKRDDPVAYATLRIWDLTFLQNDTLQWRTRLAESINNIELNLEGVRFRLVASVPVSDDFERMKKDWQEFYAFQSRVSREPDTIVLRGVPSRWFAEPRVSSKPSMLVTHTIFSTFGKIRNLNVAEDDDLGKDANEDKEDLVSGLYCKIVVQFERYRDFHDALKVLCGRSLQKEGSRLKVDYEVSWDKDGFFRNSRNQTREKNNMVSTMAAEHHRSEAPRRHTYNSHHSPDNVRPRRFKE
ncbi:hypothetical protein RJT34_08496 [Clitoria ternatea]|uniref:Uncharacterized protein n=1 Tax=Clitoria ternatea TaxID=43366 RepID=A0AAN9K7T0_CLITE